MKYIYILFFIFFHNFTLSQCTCDSYGGTTSGPTSAIVGQSVTYNRTLTCGGSPYQFEFCVSGGPYSIISGSVLGPITIQFDASGTYQVQFNMTCSGGGEAVCSSSLTVNVSCATSIAPTSITGVTSICNGNSTTLTLAGGSAGAGAIAQWFTGSCGGTAAGTGNSISVSPTSTTTYYVRYAGTCNTTTCASQVVTVNSLSTAPTGITGTTAICNGASTTLTLAGGSAGTGATAEWFTGSCGGTAAGTGNSISVSPTSTTTYYVRYAGTCNTTICASQVVTVNSLSTAPTGITGATAICNGASTTLTLAGGSAGTGATAEWFTGSCGGTAAGTGNSISVSPTSTTTYYVRYTGTCNTTTCASQVVTVNSLSTAPTSISGTTTICNGSSTTLTLIGGSAGTGAAPQWFAGSCGSTVIGTGNSIAVSPTANTTYFVRYDGTCNTTVCASQIVTVDNTPGTASNTTSTASICEGSTVALAASPAGGTWSVVSGGGSISGTTYTSPSVGSNTNVTVRYTVPANGACAGSISDAIFAVGDNLGTASNTTSTASICEGSTVALAASPAGGTWSVVSGGGTISGTTYTSPSVGSNTNVTVRYTIAANAGCAATTSDATFTVGDNLGTANNTTSTASICEGLTVALAATPAGGTWSVVSGGGTISGTTYTSPSVASNTNVTVRYTIPANAGCASTTSDATFIVTDNPGVANNTTSTASVCEGSTVALAASPAGGAWSVVTGGGTISGTTYTSPSVGSNTSVTVRYTMPASGGCAISTSDATFTVNDNLGTASNTTSTASICEGSTVALAATPAGGTWSVVSGGGTISGTTYTSPSIASNTNVTVRYTIATNGACAGSTSDATFIVNDNLGTASNTTSTASICEGSTVALAATPAGGTWSVVSGGGTISGTTYTSPSVASNTNITVRYTIATNGACIGSDSDVSFTVGSQPVSGTLSGLQNICAGSTTTFSSTEAGGSWLSANTAVASVDLSTGVISGLAGGTSVISYTVAGSGGCPDSIATRLVIVEALPSLSDFHASRMKHCVDDSFTVSLAIESTSFPVNYWIYSSTDTIVMSSALNMADIIYYDSLYASSGSYTVSLESANGCYSDSPVTIGDAPLNLQLDSLGVGSITCFGDSTDVFVRIQGGIGPYDYYLISGTDTIDYQQVVLDGFVVFQNLPVGNYSVSVVDLGQIPWYHLIGGTLRERGTLYKDSNGEFLMVGGTESAESSLGTPIGGIDGFIIKLDAQGHIIWKKRYGTLGTDYLMNIKQMANGEYVATGYKKSLFISEVYTNYDIDIWFLRLDQDGNILAEETYAAPGYDSPREVVELPSGDLIIVGGSRSNGGIFTGNHGGLEDAFAMRTNSVGQIIWTQLYGTTGQDGFSQAELLADGTVLAVGWCGGNNGDVTGYHGGYWDAWIVRIDQAGTIVTQYPFGGTNYEYFNGVERFGSDIYLVGITASNNGDITSPVYGGDDGIAVRFDESTFTTAEQLILGGPLNDDFSSIIPTIDGGFLTVGSKVVSSQDGWLTRLNSTGQIIFEETYGGSNGASYYGVYEGFGSIVKSNSDYIIDGTYASPNGDFLGNHGMEDLLVMGLGVYYCDVVSFQITQPSLYSDTINVNLCNGDSFQVGSTFYTLPGSYIDTLASSFGCDSIIYLNITLDSIAPVIANCIQDTSIALSLSCTLSMPDFTADPQLTVSDFCGDVASGTIIITQFPLAGTSLGVGMHTVMIYATDNSSNVDSCSFVLTIFDSIAPTFVNGCIADTILYSGTSTCEVLIPDFTSSSQLFITDNCGDVLNGTIVVTQSPSAGSLLGIGSHTITIYATDNNSNIDSCSFIVQVSDTISPIITVSVSSPFCDGDPVNWTTVITDNCGSPTVTSSHNSGDVFPIGTTTVTYTATDASGNVTTQSFDVVVNALPTVSVEATLLNVCSSSSVTLLVTNPNSNYVYDWTFGNGPVIYTGSNYTITNPQKANTGYYQVMATNSFGCNAMDEIHLIVEDCEIVVYQTFSPDNNGQNEYFFIEGLESFPNTSVTILNRWGAEVYHSDDYKNDWHGTSESQYNVGGDLLPEGTYFYLLELGGDPADDTYHKVYKGYVYLKR